jgi:hypothetical protein
MILLLLYYLALIYGAYLVWCCVGLLLLGINSRRRWPSAVIIVVALALFRLLLGLISGYIIFYEASPKYLLPSMRLSEGLLSSYLAIYIPVRLIEWSILALLLRHISRRERMQAADAGQMSFLGRSGAATLCWIAGGVVLSFLLDLPMLGLEKSFAR